MLGGVFSHGFINGEDGRKMSKSYNNAVSPDEVMKKNKLLHFFSHKMYCKP